MTSKTYDFSSTYTRGYIDHYDLCGSSMWIIHIDDTHT